MATIRRSQSSENSEFCDCVIAVFQNWSALQLAVDHGMGGSPQESQNKLYDMASHIATLCFSKDATYWGDIAAELEELMDMNFDTLLEDGSSDEVGELLWNLSRQWASGNKDEVNSYINGLNKTVVKNHVAKEAILEVAENMDVVEEKCEEKATSKESSDDTWTVVKNTRRR